MVESAAAELLNRTRGDRADLERHQEPRVKNAEAALERGIDALRRISKLHSKEHARLVERNRAWDQLEAQLSETADGHAQAALDDLYAIKRPAEA